MTVKSNWVNGETVNAADLNNVADAVNTLEGSVGSGAWADITGKPAVIAAGADQAAARTAIAAASRSLSYNVLDHGVVADGSTDNTTALATLVGVVVAAGGGTIVFPPNTSSSQYIGSLVLNANVPIKVVGYGASLVGPSGGTTVTLNSGVTGASGQTLAIEGLVIKGAVGNTTDGVLIKDTSRASLLNCQIVRVNNGVRIQNYTSGQNSEATIIRSTLINDSITGVFFEIVSGGPSFDETIFDDLEISNCTTGIYLPTTADLVRCRFDATVWVGRTGSTNGVLLYTDALMARVWGRLGGEKYAGATSCTGMRVGPNATGFDQADLQLHLNGSINPVVDVTTVGGSGQSALWRNGLAHYSISNGTSTGNLVGPHMKNMTDTFPRIGLSMGSPANAPMPGGRQGIFFGSGSAQADTVLFRPGVAGVLQQGFTNVFKTGQNSTGNRPSASTVGDGAQFYDTTLKRPIWSDGTSWLPAVITKGDAGLGNVDNTSDVNKPVSTAQQTAIDDAKARANHTGTQPSSTISDFTEAAQDAINALLVGASGVTLSYDDTANTLTITGGGAGGLDAEAVRDTIGVALVGTGLITVTVNDAADTITISTTATANDTDANLKARANHTGTQSADTLTDGSTNVAFLAAERTKLSGIASGATANSAEASAATASALALRDANANLLADAFVPGSTSTATASGITTLTVDSKQVQIFTGTLTQNCDLPTTGVTAGMTYLIISTSTNTVSVRSSAGNAVGTFNGVGARSCMFTALVDAPTTAANWKPWGYSTLTANTVYGTDGSGIQNQTAIANTASASAVALRTAQANILADVFIPSGTSTATSAGTLTLTNDTNQYQVLTGTTTHTVQLPTTSISIGWPITIDNASTGAVAINSSGANLVVSVPAGKTAQVWARQATPTAAAHWGYILSA